ncbi:hypothetical protein [Snuella sedimenti]|uniref:Uncharacterized protein n=1 Tax=Snuella sedimenti TaxID=2798802 RepID=A0A8J7J1U6_9FLAO|nr:hypothetical protein [Snuella sedimenti]MBJ6367499.1 hypothetical protein [Snuella sedimenti]
MKKIGNKAKYEVWLSAETMHNASREWLSELNFVKDEQLFLDDLVVAYTLQLIDSKHYKESKHLIEVLSALQVETKNLIETIRAHENGLKVMVDGVDQQEEEAHYKDTHRKLILEVSAFMKRYRALKTKLFALIKNIMKERKQKRLLQ